MSNHQPDPSWWLAADNHWYPPESHPAYGQAPGPAVHGTAGSGPDEIASRSARGAVAERRTAQELTRLPPTYRVFHALKIGRSRADIDHVVIGPTGVWVIDSKCWSSPVQITNGGMRQGRYSKQDVVESVEKQASYASSVLNLPTNAALCFVDTQLPRPVQAVGRVRVITLPSLVDYITAGTPTLSQAQIDATYRSALAWKDRPPSVPQATRARAAHSPAPTAPTAKDNVTSKKAKPGCVQVAFTALFAAIMLAIAVPLIARAGREIGSSTTTTTSAPTSPDDSTITPAPRQEPTPNYFSVEIECPEPGEGYRLAGRATNDAPGRLRITLISSLGPEYLGEIGPYERLRPESRFGPNTVIGFDVQTVNEAGQGGETYRLGLTTPAAPC